MGYPGILQFILVVALGIIVAQCAFADAIVTVGPSVTQRTQKDSKIVTIIDPVRTAQVSGKVASWDLWAMRAGDIKLQIFQPVTDGYKLIGENIVTIPSLGANTVTGCQFNIPIAEAQRLPFEPNYLLGFRYILDVPNNRPLGLIGSKDNEVDGSHKFTWPLPTRDVPVGDVLLDSEFGFDPLVRTYSLAANVLPNTTTLPEPTSMVALVIGLLGIIKKRKH